MAGTRTRTLLLLQGPTSPFFARLAEGLQRAGQRVHSIVFNMGDRVYRGRCSVWPYRGVAGDFPAFLEDRIRALGVTDLLMHGDSRPLHAGAIPVAKRWGVRVHVLEEGYFRPNWITLERDGINGRSRLPRDPAWYLETGAGLPDPGPGEAVSQPIRLLALHELGYHLPNVLNPLFYPGYRTHRPCNSALEFTGWAWRFSRLPYWQRRDHHRIDRLLRARAPYYLFPLQLDSDSQILDHSPFDRVGEALERVLDSFARHAPGEARLVIKNHPLDTGLSGLAGQVRRLARRKDLGGRLVYLETGPLPRLLQSARGVVTINSTVGTSALAHRCPLIALGAAVYDLPGLCFQGGLDAFWHHGEPPDRRLFQCFRRVVIHSVQVNGGLYSRRAIARAVSLAVPRLLASRSRLEELL